MVKNNKTKKALVLSFAAMILCVALLAGTTFAWLTDSAASGSNVIIAGNLDIEVKYTLDGATWTDLDGANDLFDNLGNDLWEPGHTEVVAISIKNTGSLALKYTVERNLVEEVAGVNKDGGAIVLSEILEVSTATEQTIATTDVALAFDTENGITYEATKTFKNSAVLRDYIALMPGETQYIIVKVDMPETVGNEANHNGTDVPSITFGINVYAAQYTYEKDSFGDQYDANAKIEKTITLTDDDNTPIAVNGNEALVLDLGGNILSNNVTNNGDLEVKNGTLESDGVTFSNNNGGNAVLSNVDIKSATSGYAITLSYGSHTVFDESNIDSNSGCLNVTYGATAEINGGEVKNAHNTNSGQRYNVYAATEGTEVVITDGDFTIENPSRKVSYICADYGAIVYVQGGNFGKAPTHPNWKYPIYTDHGGQVIITGGTFEFDPTEWVADGYVAVPNATNTVWTVEAVNP